MNNFGINCHGCVCSPTSEQNEKTLNSYFIGSKVQVNLILKHGKLGIYIIKHFLQLLKIFFGWQEDQELSCCTNKILFSMLVESHIFSFGDNEHPSI